MRADPVTPGAEGELAACRDAAPQEGLRDPADAARDQASSDERLALGLRGAAAVGDWVREAVNDERDELEKVVGKRVQRGAHA